MVCTWAKASRTPVFSGGVAAFAGSGTGAASAITGAGTGVIVGRDVSKTTRSGHFVLE